MFQVQASLVTCHHQSLPTRFVLVLTPSPSMSNQVERQPEEEEQEQEQEQEQEEGGGADDGSVILLLQVRGLLLLCGWCGALMLPSYHPYSCRCAACCCG